MTEELDDALGLPDRNRIQGDLANELNNALGAALTMIEVLIEDRQTAGAREAMLALRAHVQPGYGGKA